MTKGGLPGPFEDAAFAMQAGEVRGPVKSDFGWHIIKVNEIRAGNQQPFEAVRAQLETESRQTERDRAYNELSGKLVDAVYKNPTSPEPAARALGLAVQTTPAFSRAGGPGIASDQKVLRAAFSGSADPRHRQRPDRAGPNRKRDHPRGRPRTRSGRCRWRIVSDAVVAVIRADRQRKASRGCCRQRPGEGGEGERLPPPRPTPSW